MDVEEFAIKVEEAIENRSLQTWEVIDLRLVLRFARRRGKVLSTDLLILNWSGRTYERFAVKVTTPFVAQNKLF